MNILGISAFYHDSAAVLLQNGLIVAAAQEERFTRIKHDASFPRNAIKYCLDYGGLELNDIHIIAYYEKPLLKFERLLETYYAFAPRGLASFLYSMPLWMQKKLFLKRTLLTELERLSGADCSHITLLFAEHHLSHAASAFFASPFREAAILTIDGVGEWATATLGLGKDNQISILKELHFPHSVGLLYSAFTYYLGFKVNSGEYKLMGLAPYGNPHARETIEIIQKIKSELIDVKEDGSLWLNQEYFTYATNLTMVSEKKWEQLFGIKRRKENEALNQSHCNMAWAIQNITEDIVIRMASELKKLTGQSHLCMAGGVALNGVLNGKLKSSGLFDDIYIQPAAGDAGGAVGAALAIHYIYLGSERSQSTTYDMMQGAYLGPEYCENEVERIIRKFDAKAEKITDEKELLFKTASLIDKGFIVGWFQGRMEFGPRALGNRSILADPRRQEMIQRLNQAIKFREGFRPFAPAVLAEDTKEYFEFEGFSPYMLFVCPIAEKRRFPLPPCYFEMSLEEKQKIIKSDISAVTHVDFSARIQTVDSATNPRFYGLLRAFKEISGCGVLINTSFNVRGEPPVCTPEDAYKCFMRTAMDYLVINSYLFSKLDQPSNTCHISLSENLASD